MLLKSVFNQVFPKAFHRNQNKTAKYPILSPQYLPVTLQRAFHTLKLFFVLFCKFCISSFIALLDVRVAMELPKTGQKKTTVGAGISYTLSQAESELTNRNICMRSERYIESMKNPCEFG